MMKHCLLVIFVLAAGKMFAQTTAQEYARQVEQQKKTMLMQQMDSGVILMDLGKYQWAEQKFMYVLSNIRSVPSDLTFYFGKNSLHMGKFKQSIDWLNKYIQLKGTNGQFSEQAVTLLKQAEAEFIKEKSAEAAKTEQVLSTSYDIDCGPSGKVSCPVCKGNHVIIKPGPFGDVYKTCPYCNDQGNLTCEEYNKLLRGQLAKKGA